MNQEVLLKQIMRMLNNQNLRDEIARSAYDEVQKYDWSNVGQLYLDLYKKLLKPQPLIYL